MNDILNDKCRKVVIKTMNKRIALILIVVMALAAALIGCGSGKGTSPSTNPTEYITEVNYTGLPYHIEESEVTEEEVDSQINMIVEYASETETITEGVVEDGDTINVAFEGKINGETFEGGTSESYDITVGTTQMIDGFVEGLVGKNVGETVTLDLKFPEDYGVEDLNGKDVTFDVTINSKKITTTPELNDEFAKEYYDVETVEELREKIRGDILRDKEEAAKNSLKNDLWGVILKNTEVSEYPEEELAKAMETMELQKEDYKSQAEMYGMEWTEFLETMMGTDEAGFDEMMDKYAKEDVKSILIRDFIAEKEGITLTDKEFKDRLAEILENNNLTEETFKSYYSQTIEEYAEENGWRDSFLLSKVLDKVVELGKEVTHEEYETYIEEQLYSDTEIDGESVDGESEETTEEGTDEASEETEEESKED